jgi:ABC-type branched-subunit amino acid transport system ATPase component
MTLLRADNLTVGFGGARALEDASFTVGAGEIVAVVGPNGAGKTTLLNALSRLVAPERGTVSFAGHDLMERRPQQLAALGIARSFQQPALFDATTVLDNLLTARQRFLRTGTLAQAFALPGARREMAAETERALALLERLGLCVYAQLRPRELSYGLRKLIELARVRAAEPRLALLDEPASGLSPDAADRVTRWLRQWREELGCSILLVEHDLGFVTRSAERLLVLQGGRIVADGASGAVLADPAVAATLLGTTAAGIAAGHAS